MKVWWKYSVPTSITLLYLLGFVLAVCDGYRRRKRLMRDSRCSCCNGFQNIMIFSVPLITCVDYFFDIAVTIDWMENKHTHNLAMVSVAILLAQRLISALVFTHENGFRIGIYQFFDVEVFFLVSDSVQFERPVFGLKKYKILEGLLESLPQMMLQTYHLSKHVSKNPWLFHMSTVISILSLALCYVLSDVVGIKKNATYQPWILSKIIGMCSSVNNVDANEDAMQLNINNPDTDKDAIWLNINNPDANEDAMQLNTNNPDAKSTCFIINKRDLFCYVSLGLWRVGEVATLVSVCVAFTRIVNLDAKYGTVIISVSLVLFNIILAWKYEKVMKATIFYQKKSEKVPEERVSDEYKKPIEGFVRSISAREIDEYLKSTQKFISETSRLTKCKDKFIDWLFWVTNHIGFGIYASLALPALLPSTYVKIYYFFKILAECILIGLCILKPKDHIPAARNVEDVLLILRNEIFKDIWYYWLVGTICFFFGGMLSYCFVLDPNEWENVLEPDDQDLLKMITEKGQYAYVDRVIGNGVHTVTDIIKRTHRKKRKGYLNDEERSKGYLNDEECCDLLCEMIWRGIVVLGTKHEKLMMGNAKSSRYENYVVPALLIKYDESPHESKESKLASLVLQKLLDPNSVIKFSLADMRKAGASLTFLRFHLNADPEKIFEICAAEGFTAKDLKEEKFDLLFCYKYCLTLNLESPRQHLIDAGFKKKHVEDPVFNDISKCNLEILKSFEAQLFEMQFYGKQLKACKDISDLNLLDWFEEYRNSKEPSKGKSIPDLLQRTISDVTAQDRESRRYPSQEFKDVRNRGITDPKGNAERNSKISRGTIEVGPWLSQLTTSATSVTFVD